MNAAPFTIANVGCFGKQGYETRAAAIKQLVRLLKRHNVSGKNGALREYQCRDCHEWHLGGGRGDLMR